MEVPQHEPITEMLTKVAPPVSVTSLTLLGVQLPDVVQIITLIYLGIMMVDKLYTMYIKYKDEGKDEPS